MADNEKMGILGFVSGLAISLVAWHTIGLYEVTLAGRIMGTVFAFGMGLGGVPLAILYLEYEFSDKTSKQVKPGSKILDLESSRLHEFSFKDVQNLDRFQRISLGINELKTIDLSPLAGSTNLTELILYMNRLESIDLSPLAFCPNLVYLDLADNNLGTIDLTPLSSCTKLNALNLGGNLTSEIDLSPLSECRDLKILTIDCMKLTDVDLSPLSGCRELEFLKLNDNELDSIDITPLFECDKLDLLEIDRITLTTTLNREIEDWPKGVRKHKRRIRKVHHK
ncbi:MAG: leucine-rich repeat domain-containing protein [Candidatus Thorarchaeota archaeon]|jgi:Leucine-rich repeat (LRR) protein